MTCPTCNRPSMTRAGGIHIVIFWCPACGTIKTTFDGRDADVCVPNSFDELKEYRAEHNAMQMSDVVASNIETIKGIHEKSMRLIKRIIDESLSAHPHYEDSYPQVLAMVDKTANPVTPVRP